MSKRKIILIIAIITVALLIIFFITQYSQKLGKILSPFLIAVIIAYLLHPVVINLEEKKIPRAIAILLIYILFLIAAVTVMIFIVPEIINNTKDLINTLPEISARYEAIINNAIFTIESSKWAPDIKSAIFNEIQNVATATQVLIMESLKKSLFMMIDTVTVFFDFVLAMIIGYYFIKDAEAFKAVVLNLIPRRWRNGITMLGEDISSILSNFIQGQLLTALIVGTMESIGLFAINIKYPLVLGIIGGIANIIPYFGPIIGAVPALAIALIDSPMKAVWTAVVFIIVQQIDNAFISPKIIEGKLGLHPVTTILAVLAGGEFFGIIGMLVAVPILAIIKVVAKRIIEVIV